MSRYPGGGLAGLAVVFFSKMEDSGAAPSPPVALASASDGCLLQDNIPATIDATTVDIPRRYATFSARTSTA